MNKLSAFWLAALCAAGASAQAPSGTQAGMAPLYRSAFEQYRSWGAAETAHSWRQVNEEMGRLEGHGGHLRGEELPAAQQQTPGAHHRHSPVPERSDSPGHGSH